MEETKWNNPPLEDYKENFDVFGSADYFKNVPRKMKMQGLDKILKKLMELLDKLTNPIKNIDKGIEDFIAKILIILIGTVECKITTTEETLTTDNTNTTFTWSTGDIDHFKEEETEIIREGFSIDDNPNLVATIHSFMTNHPTITNKIALMNYYITEVNKYQQLLGYPPTPAQLFAFNVEFDNHLESNKATSSIQNITNSLPTSSYPNTIDGYKSFLKNSARFSFTNDDSISYYEFQRQYFPYPIDLNQFESEIQDATDPNFSQNITQFLASIQTPQNPPTPPEINSNIDPNYAFSINLKSSQTSTIQSYLAYISEWFSFIVYQKQSNSSAVSFSIIESNVCMTYIQFINAVEFQKYRIYSTFLTPFEIAMFNHLFYICLMQDDNRNNIFNVSADATKDVGGFSVTSLNSNIYINLLPLNVSNMMLTFIVEINKRLPYLSAAILTNNYQPLPIDVVKIITLGPNPNMLLTPYLLDTPIQPTQDIINYFVPMGLSDCDQANADLQKECKQYANTIKQELYRLLTIPIILYIVYNFYFLFFFKDCLSPTQVTNETGKITYKHTCESGEKGGCFTPFFPDWETMFHMIEKHNTDFIFEFVFKPVKYYYTFVNAFKALFRKEISGHVIKDDVPYLFFLFSFWMIYHFINNNGHFILGIFEKFMKFELPNVPFMGRNALTSYAKGLTMILFLFSFIAKVFGNKFTFVQESMYEVEETTDENGEIKKTETAPEVTSTNRFSEYTEDGESHRTWLKWLIMPTSALLFVVKCISFILYWLFKFMISLAMVPVAVTIFIIYFFWNMVFGIFQYTTPINNVGSKIDLIYRIIYTKLCDNDQDGLFKYIAKSMIFFCIYLLTEFIILHKLYQGAKSFLKMPTAFVPNVGLSPNPNVDVNKTNLSVKSAMIFLYGIMFFLVILWCIYKVGFRMSGLVRGYKEQEDDTRDKRFHYDCTKKDVYEEESKNSFLKTIMMSDSINKTAIEDFKKKTSGIKKPSMMLNIIDKMSGYGESISKNISERFEKMQENAGKAVEKRQSFFGKVFGRNATENTAENATENTAEKAAENAEQS
jgi:hypothetical protein